MSGFQARYLFTQTRHIGRCCICPSCDRLSFYLEIQIIFGIVYGTLREMNAMTGWEGFFFMFVAYCIMYTVHCTRIQYRKTASFCCSHCRLHLCISLMHQKALVPASLLLPWLLNFTFFYMPFSDASICRLHYTCVYIAFVHCSLPCPRLWCIRTTNTICKTVLRRSSLCLFWGSRWNSSVYISLYLVRRTLSEYFHKMDDWQAHEITSGKYACPRCGN